MPAWIYVREKKSSKNLGIFLWTFWNQIKAKNWSMRAASCLIVSRDHGKWRKLITYLERIENGNLRIGFKYEIFQPAKVLVRKEMKLYTLINFFAEVGGYLGLLLGEILFSYLISASSWFTILSRKFKEHCRKTDKTPETSSI